MSTEIEHGASDRAVAQSVVDAFRRDADRSPSTDTFTVELTKDQAALIGRAMGVYVRQARDRLVWAGDVVRALEEAYGSQDGGAAADFVEREFGDQQ